MEGFLRLGFFSMAEKITETLKGSFAYILTGAIIIAIWIYFLFLVPRKQRRYDKFSDYLQDVFNFEIMLGSGLAKILYIAFAIVLIVVGIVAMFVTNFFIGLLGTLILEIILRVLFEIFMVIFSIQSNILAIREKVEKRDEEYYYEE
ncbi:MAG: hypothetical protein GX022_09895 [Clostridiaceae bacterium]|nr:hypothetical protein [Clostridiaceae bacterium]